MLQSDTCTALCAVMQRAMPIMTCAGTHGGDEVALLLVQGGHALHHVAVGFRVAVLEGQLLQLLLDGIQPQQPRKRRKDLHKKSIMSVVAMERPEGCRQGVGAGSGLSWKEGRRGAGVGERVGLQGGAGGRGGGGASEWVGCKQGLAGGGAGGKWVGLQGGAGGYGGGWDVLNKPLSPKCIE